MNIKLYDYIINGHDVACYKTTCLINLKWSAVSWKLNVTWYIQVMTREKSRVWYNFPGKNWSPPSRPEPLPPVRRLNPLPGGHWSIRSGALALIALVGAESFAPRCGSWKDIFPERNPLADPRTASFSRSLILDMGCGMTGRLGNRLCPVDTRGTAAIDAISNPPPITNSECYTVEIWQLMDTPSGVYMPLF